MIYTLTLNPSIDYHIWLSSLSIGAINKVEREQKVAGGKGINVSKVLKTLGMASVALGFVGGFTGKFIQEEVEYFGIDHQFIQISEDSRINIKIKSGAETDLTGRAPSISQEALENLLSQLDCLTGEDEIVLAGSVPDSLPNDIYQTIMEKLFLKEVRVFLDTSGKSLEQAISHQPFLIKPNHHELGGLFQTSIESSANAIKYGKKAVEMGAQNVIVSLAGKGAVFINEKEAYVAEIPTREAVNSIGAGDSMVAGFLYSFLKKADMRTAFQFAVAAGSATALSEGFCSHESIAKLLPEIRISNG